MISCIIVDDDPMACMALKRLCTQHAGLDLLHVFQNAGEARQHLLKNPVDLIFLDVEMPEMTGLELLAALPQKPRVIFTTAKTDYAFEAFEVQAVDYLKKPIFVQRFEEAIQKVLDKMQTKEPQPLNEIYLRVDGKFIRMDYDDILFFENVGDYVRVKLQEKQHIIYGTLKSLEDKLSSDFFLKVHRSYIVNLSKIEDIQENTLVIGKAVIPISRAHRPALMKRLRVI